MNVYFLLFPVGSCEYFVVPSLFWILDDPVSPMNNDANCVLFLNALQDMEIISFYICFIKNFLKAETRWTFSAILAASTEMRMWFCPSILCGWLRVIVP